MQSPDAKDFKHDQGHIEFQKVSFGHEKDDGETDFLFKDFDIEIKPGTTNAIVGPSGFGKTTLLHLMFRMYDPKSGKVIIDGQDVKDLTLDSFRKHICVIPQNGILFNDTLIFNLKYGNPDATIEEIKEVCRKCSIHNRIMTMEHGYDT